MKVSQAITNFLNYQKINSKKKRLRITGCFLTNSIHGMETVILNQLTLIRF